jgi:hypothetical protein
MPTHGELQELFAAAERSWGAHPAEILMELLPPSGWGEVARRSDLDAFGTSLRGEMAVLRSELKGDIAELRVELKSDIARLESRIDGLLPRQLLANVPLAFAVAGLVLATLKLA